MRKTLIAGTVVLILGLISQRAAAQQIDSMMAVYEDKYPYEKIHVQFDKEAYNKEETIWYKAYVVTGLDLSDVSRNLYVEWYDTTGRMIKQTVAPLYLSSAKGAFELPADYTGNFIQMRVFTRWMLNEDSSFLYERRIPINNSTNAAAVKKPAVVYRTKLEIFPEGGFLVQGLTSRVAFKASNQFGNPVMFTGILVNNKNVTIDSLTVEHDGMGSFPLTPMEGESYHVNWTDEYGRTGTTQITDVKPQGVSLSVGTTNDKAIVQVERTSGVADNFKQFNLLVHMNQKLFFKAALKGADKLIQRANIPIDELPTGVLQFSLFTSDWIPVAERVIFINNHTHEFNAKVVPQITSMEKRGKNVIDIQVADTAIANMSIAITDADVPIPEMNTIFSDILISGEIKGKIYNPAYYLTSDADSITAHLDLVMLTNGWRRFDWDKIKAGIVPKLNYPEETDFMAIQGHVFGLRSTGSSLPMLNLIIVGKDSTKQLKFLDINKDGSFRDNSSLFYDTVRIFYNFNESSKLNNTMQVKFDNGLLIPQPKKVQFGLTDPVSRWSDSLSRVRMTFFLTQQEALKKAMAAVTLQEVIVKSRAKKEAPMQELDKQYASGLFSGGDGYAFDFNNDPFANSALDVLSYLQGKVAGLTISGSGTNATLSWRGSTPALFLNEMQVGVDMVQTVAVPDIAYVKVFRPPFFGASGGGGGGAIAVYTKKGSEGRKSGAGNAKGMENTVLGGYSRFKEFYNPVYEKPNEGMESDTRTTLYWNPYIITNKKSPRYRIEFYNNDFSKKLQLVLEGLNSDGKMVRVVKTLE